MSLEHRRMTDRSKTVIRLAMKEAAVLRAPFVNPEHILLGLAREGKGVAANVLLNFDVDYIRILAQSSAASGNQTKPEPSKATEKLIDTAFQIALSLNHNYIGTEHLLLAVLEEGEPLRILASLGLSKEQVREEILVLIGIIRPGECSKLSAEKNTNPR